MTSTFDLAAVRRAVVVRVLPGLGDMLCLVPALKSLRCAAPGALVTLVSLDTNRWMIDRYPGLIDDLIPVTYWPGVPEAKRGRASWPAVRGAWTARAPDLAVQLHGSGRTTNRDFVRLDAGWHAGHHPADQPRPGPLFRPWPESGHEAERLCELVQWLGGPAVSVRLEFPVRDDDTRSAQRAFGLDAPYACIHPGASRHDRRWDHQGFARVADHLAEQGLQVLVTGSATEHALAQTVADAARHHAENVAGRTELGQLAALLRHSVVTVSNDTGVAHLAAAVDAPSVVVITTSDAARWGPLPSPRRRMVLGSPSPSVDDVIDAVDELLVRSGTR